MADERMRRTPRQKYGEELKIRRLAAEMTQEALSDGVVCSPTLISHFEAGRRLSSPADAQRIDMALGTDGFFARWLTDLDGKYAEHFNFVAEFERQATEIRHFSLSVVPGLLQTGPYAREMFRAYRPNHQAKDLDRRVVNRLERAQILENPEGPVLWCLVDETVLRRRVGGPRVMADQLGKMAGMAEAGRLRLHVVPFAAGAHALVESMLYLMSFEDAPPISYVEGFRTGHLMDDPAMVRDAQRAYNMVLGDALSHVDSVALVRAVAEEYEHEAQ
ncbi:helix-turn-helix domain-containing protein [Streptomyces sp. NRRL F-5135]|uniref:helix-turn-helix domain-containing protein n=1 Tax=Streptomyces sp. NRRL F-5135 TaxID=1463858 RepID=UPI0004C617A7|nr:helix-turn-helix transcriptional regulator [Streptomyces sp. NRRL F-5135]